MNCFEAALHLYTRSSLVCTLKYNMAGGVVFTFLLLLFLLHRLFLLRFCLFVVSYMLSGVGDNCPRWGCIRTGGGSSGRRRNDGGHDADDDDDNDDEDDDGGSVEAYDLATDGGGAACCPGSQCVPTRRHRRRRKSSSARGGRDKSPGKLRLLLQRPRGPRCWPRCLSLLFGGRRLSGCCNCCYGRGRRTCT